MDDAQVASRAPAVGGTAGPPTRVPPAPQRLSRRKALALAGSGTLVLAVGGGVWRAADQGVFSTSQGPAYAPWDDWRSATPSPLNLVRAAILAANPHDAQAWRFRVADTPGDTHIALLVDPSRRIGLADPFLTEMYIGVGCALENLLLAAPADGFSPHLSTFPDPTDATYVARIDLAAGPTSTSELYRAIPRRHTNRYPYVLGRTVSASTLAGLEALNGDPLVRVVWFTSAADRQRVGEWMKEAAQAFVADTALNRDDNRWYRATWQDVQRERDGITLDAAGLPDLTRALGKMLPPASLEQQNSYFVQGVQQRVQTAAVFGLLAVPNRREHAQRMAAGRLWQRMHLWATTQGLAMQPLNQLTELMDREVVLGSTPRFGDAVRGLVGDPGWQALLTFRLGYPTHEALRSPRRAVSAVLRR
jgi:hypothetical protein